MAFISLQNIFLSYGQHPLLDGVNLHIQQNQRICLLGRNGTGKSTLMKIMAGAIPSDSGQIITDNKINIRYFEQDIPEHKDGIVFDIIANGFPEMAKELQIYFRDEEQINDGKTVQELKQEQIHTPENWERLQRIRRIAQDLNICDTDRYNNLSGGQKRRALLAAALVSKPDLLLLDEPTNHLDIATINWLEEYILKFCPTVVFVTHDRAFLKRLANRIVELDRGKLFDYDCTYNIFLQRKQAWLEAQEKEWSNFDRKLSEEETWLRKGIKARRTRNEGRVKALLKMREERQQRRVRQGSANLKISSEKKSGKIVIEAENISFSYADTPILHNFSVLISRGDKIGIIGANGCGKTTLVKLLLGKLKPSAGSVKTGTNLSVTFFDQMRGKIDLDKTVQENVQPNGDTVLVNGKHRHILSYLQDFLFPPDRARSPVSQLSGGERNRLLLAKLFTQPCNVLVMDEPTNDLDAETLELLEDLIVEFPGTVLVISHDRMFLNNTTSSLLVFQSSDGKDTGAEGNNKSAGEIVEIAGGYDDWLVYQERQKQQDDEKSQSAEKTNEYKNRQRIKTKLSFNEQKELEEFPTKIEQMETEKEQLYKEMAKPEVHQNAEKIIAAQEKLKKLENELKNAYERWEHLETEAEKYKS